MKTNLNTSSQNGKNAKVNATNAPIQASQLIKLLENELKDIFWAEKAFTKAIPNMIKNATSIELIEVLCSRLDETNKQVERLAKIFAIIEKKPVAKKSEAMEELIKEADEIMESCEVGAMRDAGIISAAQKVGHYKTATYGTLCQYTETLGFSEAIRLLAATLEEEKAADEKLSEVATSTTKMEDEEIKA